MLFRSELRVESDTAKERFNFATTPFGFHYDPVGHRYWMVSTTTGTVDGIGAGYLTAAYSDEHSPTNWTWIRPPLDYAVLKSGFAVNDNKLYIGCWVYGWTWTPDAWGVGLVTYDLDTDTWSSLESLVTNDISTLTERTLATAIASTDVMDGSGTITLSGAATSYPEFGAVIIGSEIFWYRSEERRVG